MSSNNLCHCLDLKIHSVVEIQIQAYFAISNKKENSRWTVTRNEKNSCFFIEMKTNQRIFNRVFRIHQIICGTAYGLVLKIHSVVEIQIPPSFAIKMKTVDGL